MHVVALPLSCSFSNGTEKVIYFSVLSPIPSNWPLNSSANSLIMKWWSYVEPLLITTGISLGTL